MEMNSWLEFTGLLVIDSLLIGSIVLFVSLIGLFALKQRSAKLRHNFVLAMLLLMPISTMYSLQRHQMSNEVMLSRKGHLDMAAVETVMVSGASSDYVVEDKHSFSPSSIKLTDLVPAIGCIWLVGFAVFMIRHLLGLRGIYFLRNNSLPSVEDKLQKLFDVAKRELCLSAGLEIRYAREIISPQIVGFIKPVILFPLGLMEGMSTEELELIIRHELAHVRRKDHLVNLLVSVLKVFYFFNPAFWWLASQLDNEREFATDDLALRSSQDALNYARALTQIESFRQAHLSLAFAGNSKNQLLKRIKRMTQKKNNTNWLSGIFSLVMIIGMFLLTSIKDWNAQTLALPENQQLLTTVDSTEVDFVRKLVVQADTDRLSIALKEILEKEVEIEFDEQDQMKSIKRNGQALEGETLAVYREAYDMLTEFSESRRDKQIDAQQEQLLRLEAQAMRRQLQAMKLAEQSAKMQADSLRVLENEMAMKLQKMALENGESVQLMREQALRVRQEYLEFYIQSQEDEQGIETEYAKLLEMLENLRKEAKDGDKIGLITVTTVSEEEVSYAFRDNLTKEELEWTWDITIDLIEKHSSSPAIVINGTFIQEIDFAQVIKDYGKENIKELAVYKGQKMRSMYKRKQIKDHDAVIAISTHQ